MSSTTGAGGLFPGGAWTTRAPKTSERVARELVNHIIGHDLAEGAKLPNEKQLVEVFDVGRTTLREALRLLETRGVITIRSGPGGGPVVRRPRPDDLREGLTLILQFAGASLTDVLEARASLEPRIASLAATRLTSNRIEELARSVETMRDSCEDHDVFLDENRRFHTTIAEASGSSGLWVFNETLKSIADGAVVGVEYTPRRRLAVAEAHHKIVEALRSRDPRSAEAAMRAHVEEAGAFWGRHYPELSARGVRWVQ